MEQSAILSPGAGRRVLTHDEFRRVFTRSIAEGAAGRRARRAGASRAAAPPDGRVRERGDHDLNPGMVPPAELRQAAVLVPVVARAGGLTVLLTRRSDDLPVHSGQVSFPGGRVEAGDLDARDTALRETEEEVGLDRDRVDPIGELDTYYTRTGFEITPVVGLVSPPFALRPDPVEVAEIFEVPLDFVLDRANHRRDSRPWQNRIRHFYVLPYKDYYIWGATAGMLVNLADVMLAPGLD